MPKLKPQQDTERANKLYRQAKFLNSSNAETTFELAETLTNLYDTDRHAFVQFYNEHNLGKRKAYYLVEIHRKYTEMGIDRKVMIQVGWTKLMLMLPKINRENANDYITYAIEHNVKELSAYVAGRAAPKLKQVLFTLTKEQEELIAPVINCRNGKSREENLIDFFKQHLGRQEGNLKLEP